MKTIVYILGLVFITSGLLLVSNSASAVSAESVRKTADQTLSAGTALQDDAELTIHLHKNTTYVVDAILFFQGSSAIPAYITAPTGSVVAIAVDNDGTKTVITANGTDGTFDPNISVGGHNPTPVSFVGTVRTGNTDGELKVRWGTDTIATTLKAGSYLRIDPI